MARHLVSGLSLVGSLLLLQSQLGLAAETSDPVERTTTRVAIALGTADRVPIRAVSQDSPPAIEIRFPRQRVTATLPERVALAGGAIQAIEVRYDSGGSAGAARFIQSLRLVLSGPYAHHVQSEPGRVMVEIEHPASLGGASMEVGVGNGQIVRSASVAPLSERFRAMQAALARARPTSVTMQWTSSGSEAAAPAGIGVSAGQPVPSLPHHPAGAGGSPASRTTSGPRAPVFPILGVGLLIGLAIIGAAGSWWLSQRQAAATRDGTDARNVRLPSGVLLIDQLVWKAFERQGHQLIVETELAQPPLGTLRIIAKDGLKAALLFVGSGRFFEKQTVERFIRAMRDARVEQGFLAASGSFTVPAQRMAKEHQITLIGRDQLVELLSMGAGSEYFTRQLEQSHARLEEAKETLRQYAAELDTLRRQRNEASWSLGEERATSAKLEAKLEELEQQVRRYDADLQHWEQEAAALRKQWEESQWYLGEARERGRHLESQVSALQELAARVEAAERERDAAAGSLSEERAKSTSLAARLEELERELEASRQRSRELEETFARLQEELAVYRTLGERRHAGRMPVPDATVDLLNGGEEPAASASLRDLSTTGLGLETDREVPEATLLRLRVRVPGREPLESKARLVWQHPEESAGRYRSGCRFVQLPASTRAALQELITQAPRA